MQREKITQAKLRLDTACTNLMSSDVYVEYKEALDRYKALVYESEDVALEAEHMQKVLGD